jgi:hypothetical protein
VLEGEPEEVVSGPDNVSVSETISGRLDLSVFDRPAAVRVGDLGQG